MTGKKNDLGKLRYDLLEPGPLREVVKVITYGANEYGERNWQQLQNFEARYFAAEMRHFEARRDGVVKCPDSGLYHTAHAAVNNLFLLWWDMKGGQ